MEMASKAIGRLAMAGDTFTAEYVEFEVKRALEWLGADRNEGRRHAAVSTTGLSQPGQWGLLCVLLPSAACPGKRIPGRELERSRVPQGGGLPSCSLVGFKEGAQHQPWVMALSVPTLQLGCLD